VFVVHAAGVDLDLEQRDTVVQDRNERFVYAAECGSVILSTLLRHVDHFTDPAHSLVPGFSAVLARDPGLVHCRDASGATPLLQVLYMSKDPALVKLLLDAKADVNAVDNSGDTALLKLATVDTPLSFRDRLNTRCFLRQLMDAGFDVTRCVEGKQTPLMRLMGSKRSGDPAWGVCLEWGPLAGRGLLQDIIDAILYRPVVG
jgi:hypothetical protein